MRTCQEAPKIAAAKESARSLIGLHAGLHSEMLDGFKADTSSQTSGFASLLGMEF